MKSPGGMTAFFEFVKWQYEVELSIDFRPR